MTTLSQNPLVTFAAAIAVSALNLSFLAAPAEAGSVRVDVSAYTVATPEGRAAVATKVERAAHQVCGNPATYRDFARNRAVTECVADATAQAMQKVHGASVRYAMAN
jgi:UrcA family protein